MQVNIAMAASKDSFNLLTLSPAPSFCWHREDTRCLTSALNNQYVAWTFWAISFQIFQMASTGPQKLWWHGPQFWTHPTHPPRPPPHPTPLLVAHGMTEVRSWRTLHEWPEEEVVVLGSLPRPPSLLIWTVFLPEQCPVTGHWKYHVLCCQ